MRFNSGLHTIWWTRNAITLPWRANSSITITSIACFLAKSPKAATCFVSTRASVQPFEELRRVCGQDSAPRRHSNVPHQWRDRTIKAR